MSSIVFRTNAGHHSGLGHLVRCVNLARELAGRGLSCELVVDCLEEGVASFLAGFPVHALYPEPQAAIDPEIDAPLFLQRLQTCLPDWVVLDDYRIGERWEALIQEAGYRLCAIDDLQRRHRCDVLVDSRWRGAQTAHAYDGLLPMSARKLLGPAYVMLAPQYRNAAPPRQQEGVFRVMIALGGGGELTRLQGIVDSLLAGASASAMPLRLLLVIGPLASGGEALRQRYRHDDRVEFLQGESDLYPHLCRTDLYIGAAGSMIYQLRALQIPALTFAIADNQQTDWQQHEDIGHFFHVERWGDGEEQALPAFVNAVQCHYQRVVELGRQPRIRIDGSGCERLADVLLDAEVAAAAGVSPRTAEPAGEELIPGCWIRPVRDGDINHYFASHQHPVDDNAGGRLRHYAWWFGRQRRDFLLTCREEPRFYLWYDLCQCQGADCVVGSWFSCSGGEPQLPEVQAALAWLLEHSEAAHPGSRQLLLFPEADEHLFQPLCEQLSLQPADDLNGLPGSCAGILAQRFELDSFRPALRRQRAVTEGRGDEQHNDR